MIDDEGENLGILDTTEALKIARERELDLIEISATANPPVCKIMDFGKFKYEQAKNEREKQKKQKEIEIKGIRIGFTTSKHDLELRAGQAEKFLERGDRVFISMKLRGREKAHVNVALEKFKEILDMISVPIILETPPTKFPQGIQATIIKGKSTVKTNHEKSSPKKN